MATELSKQRKNEIIEACLKLYQTKGYKEVTIKTISEKTTFSRPSIYNYFETKEEIFLALLTREYDKWTRKLESLSTLKKEWSKDTFSQALAHTLEDQEIMLKIHTMNLYEIEENCRQERLVEYKESFYKAMLAVNACLKTYKSNISEDEINVFIYTFFPFLYGIYSFANPSDKQLAAMDTVHLPYKVMSIYTLAYQSIYKLLPEKE